MKTLFVIIIVGFLCFITSFILASLIISGKDK
jgi:hypothetical protein